MEQYELRELHFLALMRTKECEVQLSLARCEEHRKRAEDEMKKSRTLNSQVSTFSQTETELRSQLNIYVEKFKQACLSLPSALAVISCVCLVVLQYAASKRVRVPICTIPHDGVGGQMPLVTSVLQPSALSCHLSNVFKLGGGNSKQL